MGFLRHTRDGGRRAPAGDDAGPDPEPTTTGSRLAHSQRARIDSELTERGIGDTLERQMFLAALDYQIASFSHRLSETTDSSGGLAEAVCIAAAQGFDGGTADDAQVICRAFVAELARAYDACFETAPTADSDGPFSGVLRALREATGLMLHCDRHLIAQAIGTVTADNS
jgi:hypothetical protein